MKFKLTLLINLIFSGYLFAQEEQITFTHQNINFSAAPRTSINPMSIKLWDNYDNGGPTSFGTVMEIYGLAGHQTGQLYFGGWDNSKIRYREAFYAQNAWSDWMTLLDSKNDVQSSGKLMITGAGNHYINGGNVGIGTDHPDQKFTIKGGGIGFDYNSSDKKLFSPIDGDLEWMTHNLAEGHGFAVSQQGEKKVYLNIAGDSYFTGGNVGIGTTTPNAMLDVNGAAIINGPPGVTLTLKKGSTNVPSIAFQGANQAAVLEGGDDYLTAYLGGTRRFSILSNGNVGIGMDVPTAKLDIMGNLNSFNTAFGQSNAATSTKNYANFSSNNHGSVLISSNLFFYGSDDLKIARTHPSLSGASILIPGNGQPNQGSIVFYTNTPTSVTEDQAYAGKLSMAIKADGNIGIGTANPQEKLTVAGTIGTREIKVSTNTGADFVFETDYQLTDLTELEKFVKTNKHLPEIPTAKQMIDNGVNLGELNIKLLQKLEELTLHLIKLNKKVDAQQAEINRLNKKP